MAQGPFDCAGCVKGDGSPFQRGGPTNPKNYSRPLFPLRVEKQELAASRFPAQIERLRIPVIPFDAEQARIASSLWKSTRPFGLSLGDRACLSLALKLSVPALTTERD